MITREELKRLLHYDLNTGIFTWRVNRGGGVKAGDIAGGLNSKGYIQMHVMNKLYRAHRLAFLYMLGYIPEEIDHDDKVRSNNKWINLNRSNPLHNAQNQSVHKHNTSDVTGVCYSNNGCAWIATITVNYKTIYLGSSKDKAKAVEIRRLGELKYRGC
jgi:hypothetical protein